MEMNKYIRLAMRTAPKNCDFQEDILHAGLGMTTEVGELVDQLKRHIFYKKPYDRVHLVEEVGDVLWYVALASRALGIQPTLMPSTVDDSMLGEQSVVGTIFGRMVTTSSRFSAIALTTLPTLVKDPSFEEDRLAGNCPICDILIETTFRLYNSLGDYCKVMGISIEEAMSRNVAKLQARFPEGFTEDKAVNRDLSAERVALEQ